MYDHLSKHDELNYILIEDEELVLLTSKKSDIARRIPSGTQIDIREAKNEKFVCSKHGHSVRQHPGPVIYYL